jgi:hypothetical protein
MIFGTRVVNDMKKYKFVLDFYCKSIEMEVNIHKYCIPFNGIAENVERQITQIVPISSTPLDKGIKYLGFLLKPSDYKLLYLNWLYLKI